MAAGKSPPPRQGVVQPVSPSVFRSIVLRTFLWFSQVPREPHCAFALLLDSAGASMPSLDGISVLPPNRQTRRASGFSSFEAQSHSLSTRCLRFMPPSRTTMQNSLPVMASFSGWDSIVPTEFRWAVSASWLPPPLSLSWRDCRSLCRIRPIFHMDDKVTDKVYPGDKPWKAPLMATLS